MIPAFGWKSTFVVAAALTIALLVISGRFLPEFLDFLLTKRLSGALEKINAILATLMLWIGYACLVAAYYLVNTWAPKIIATASANDSAGVTVGVIANADGILGCFLCSALAMRFLSQRLLVLTLACSAVAYLVFGLAFHVIPVAMAVAFVLGILTTGERLLPLRDPARGRRTVRHALRPPSRHSEFCSITTRRSARSTDSSGDAVSEFPMGGIVAHPITLSGMSRCPWS